MKQTKVFEADDGSTFATAAECRLHEEKDRLTNVLSGLGRHTIRGALERRDPDYLDLANAIERAGNIIAAKRRESGELKRNMKAVS